MQNSERDRLIEKIKALLEHTTDRGATEAEAVNFALKAQKLMVENGISDGELNAASGNRQEAIVEQVAPRWFPRQWRVALANVIAPNFRCKWYATRTTLDGAYEKPKKVVTFLGYESDAAALAVFSRLYDIGEDLAAGFVKQKSEQCDSSFSRKDYEAMRKSYLWGYCEGIEKELEKQSVALMVTVPLAVRERYDGMNIGSRKVKKFDVYPNAVKAGRDAGRDAVRAGRVGAGKPDYQLSA